MSAKFNKFPTYGNRHALYRFEISLLSLFLILSANTLTRFVSIQFGRKWPA
jgi:hypothetical protein